ncbi:MAG TPA: hypothetical protein EYO78_09235, partial [Gammaproteobacteria bacterium]|nr:hypothetical protein [Gammaproteobacteria bacterium]
MVKPLTGIRVLSMEQAAALPFATRHLADLGAEVIRIFRRSSDLAHGAEVFWYQSTFAS